MAKRIGSEGGNSMAKELILLIGGARSGKSAFAQHLAGAGHRVLFVATAEAGDDEMAARIAVHRKARPTGWDTLEEPVELANALGPVHEKYDTILLDCLTLWVSNLLAKNEGGAHADAPVMDRLRDLLSLYEAGHAAWIIVSNEVGLGIVPLTPLGRLYRDTLGRVNQAVATRADKVYWMMAGLTVEMKSLGAKSVDAVTLEKDSP